MDISQIIERVLLEDIVSQIQQLKDKYVGKEKPMTEEDFKKIEEVSKGKWFLIAWLTKKVATKILKAEDLYKWEEYLEIFEKNKKKFKFQDINLFKTPEDIQNFIETAIEIREGDSQFEEIAKSDYFLTKNEIEKLSSEGGSKYLGLWKPKLKPNDINKDGYQVYVISSPTESNWKVYRDLLGRCKGRGRGAKIDICTIGSYNYFKDYLRDFKGSSYIVLFNLNDPMSPYQLHVESDQFYNKNDSPRYNFAPMEFLEWLSENYPYYNLEKMTKHMSLELPVKGLGTTDDKGKQGLWRFYREGDLASEITYVNGQTVGPYKLFYRNGQISDKGTYKKGEESIGDYEEYTYEGKLKTKGQLSKQGAYVGLWFRDLQGIDWNSENYLVNYDEPNSLVTGLKIGRAHV